MAGTGLTEQQRAKIVEMYNAEAKIHEIEAAVGTSRSTVYYVLNEAGVRPNRIRPRSRIHEGAPVLERGEYNNALAWALARIEQLERDNGMLRGRLSAIDALLRSEG